jgi:chloramphenicol 3-O-phosphotransferase
MKLVFLHGEPASGKLTIARALLRRVPGRLLENHAAIDFAKTVFDFGASGFWELVEQVRLAALEAAAEHGVRFAVCTYCYSEPHDRAQFERFEAIVGGYGGEVLPVFLACSEAELGRRIGNADRAARGKITTMQGLARFRDGYNLIAVPRADCLRLETSAMPVDAAAAEIVRHFRLG